MNSSERFAEKVINIIYGIINFLSNTKKGIKVVLSLSLLLLIFNMVFPFLFQETFFKEISKIPIDFRIFMLFFVSLTSVFGFQYAYFDVMDKPANKYHYLLLGILVITCIIGHIIYGPLSFFLLTHLSRKVVYYFYINIFMIILLPPYVAVLKASLDKEYKKNVRAW